MYFTTAPFLRLYPEYYCIISDSDNEEDIFSEPDVCLYHASSVRVVVCAVTPDLVEEQLLALA